MGNYENMVASGNRLTSQLSQKLRLAPSNGSYRAFSSACWNLVRHRSWLNDLLANSVRYEQ